MRLFGRLFCDTVELLNRHTGADIRVEGCVLPCTHLWSEGLDEYMSHCGTDCLLCVQVSLLEATSCIFYLAAFSEPYTC